MLLVASPLNFMVTIAGSGRVAVTWTKNDSIPSYVLSHKDALQSGAASVTVSVPSNLQHAEISSLQANKLYAVTIKKGTSNATHFYLFTTTLVIESGTSLGKFISIN